MTDQHGKTETRVCDLLIEYVTTLEHSTLDEDDPAGTAIQSNFESLSAHAAEELDALRECADLLERKRLEDHANVLGKSLKSETNDLPHQIGRFQILEEIGRGGGGVVLLAHDPKLGREVALKLPHPQVLVLPDLRRRFIQEAQAVASLQHPNILAVHEVGETGAVCYIASPYIAGLNLSQWMETRSEAISVNAAVQLTLQIADAVQFAHSRGILHRDIKPSNILLEINEEDPTSNSTHVPLAKLADFGLAKRIDEENQELTQTGTVLGTPRYMAPEQVEANTQSIGTHTDTWAIGVLLHELLTGVSPFAADSKAATFQKILSSDSQNLAALPPHIPADMRAICRKCLQASPVNRYESVAALIADLKRFQAGTPTEARPLSSAESTIRWIRRHPALSLCFSVVAAAVLLITVISLISADRVNQALRETEDLLYSADISLAAQAIENTNSRHAIELLSRHIPSENKQDRRNFAWHYLWGVVHREEAVLTMPNEARAVGVSYTPDGRYLLTAAEGDSTELHFWDVATSTLAKTLPSDDRVVRIEFGATGQKFATVNERGKVELWNFDESTPFSSHQITHRFDCGDFDEERNELITAGDDGQIQIVTLGVPKAEPRVLGQHHEVEDVAFSPDGKWIASCGGRSSLKLWDRTTGKCVQAKFEHSQKRLAARLRFDVIKFSSDGGLLAVGASFGDIFVWNTEERIEVAHYADHTSNIYDFAFSRDGKRLASASKDSSVRVWDLRSDCKPAVIQGHGRPIYGVCFSADGEHIATCGKDGTVRLWNQLSSSFSEHQQGEYNWLEYSSSKLRFANFAMDFNGTVRQTSMRASRTLGRHQNRAMGNVSTDGKYGVSASGPLVNPARRSAVRENRNVHRVDLDADGDLDLVSSVRNRLVWQESVGGDFRPARLFLDYHYEFISNYVRTDSWKLDGLSTVVHCEHGRGTGQNCA